MAHSEYDLQALIYSLALHRWLRFRLGDGYDYARDFGGVRYVFCRGLDATREDAQCVQAWRFDPDLIHALAALFSGGSELPSPREPVPLSRERERGWGERVPDRENPSPRTTPRHSPPSGARAPCPPSHTTCPNACSARTPSTPPPSYTPN